MKKLVSALLLVGAAAGVRAQSPILSHAGVQAPSRTAQSILRAQRAQSPNARTTAFPNVLAESNFYFSNGVKTPLDSMSIYYSGGRTSVYDFSGVGYNYFYPDGYTPFSMPYTGDQLDVKSDSMVRYGYLSQIYQLTNRWHYTYSAQNNLLTDTNRLYKNGGALDTSYSYGVNRNAGDKVKDFTVYKFFGSFKDSSILYKYFYDGQGRFIGDSALNARTHAPVYYDRYTYNAAGNMDSNVVSFPRAGGWKNYYYSLFDYTAANKLKSETDYTVTDTVLFLQYQPYSKDSFAYNPTNSFTTYQTNFSYTAAGVRTQNYEAIKHLAANGVYDTLRNTIRNAAGQPTYMYLLSFSYNPDGSPSGYQTYEVDSNKNSHLYEGHWYYTRSTGVAAGAPVAAGKVAAMPNPVRDVLHIDCTEPMQVRLFNLSGQLLYQVHVASKERLELPVRDLPAGSYLLQTEGATVHQSQLIVKE